jgi:hypothetical protein
VSKSCYKIDFKAKIIDIYNIEGVGELITSLQSLLKEWKEYRIIIHNKNDESKADI